MTEVRQPATPSRRTVLLALGATAVSAVVAVGGSHDAGRLHRPEPVRTLATPRPLSQVDDRMPPPAGLAARVESGSATIVTQPPATDVAINFALAQLGAPYVWGATGPHTFDCSGLTLRSYQAAGVQLPRTSREQARVGTRIPASAGFDALAPGDLVFWAYRPNDLSTVHHVAIYLGDRKVVHAPQTGDVVKVSTIWPTEYAGGVRVA